MNIPGGGQVIAFRNAGIQSQMARESQQGRTYKIGVGYGEIERARRETDRERERECVCVWKRER